MWEKSKETSKCEKRTVTSDVGTAQCKDRIVKFVKKRSKGTAKWEKKTITCDVGTIQCMDRIVKYEKIVREPLNMRKELLYVMLVMHNVRMKPLSVRIK